jgi:PhnB protein
MSDGVSPIPEGHHTVTPYLLVEDAHGLLDFVQRAFGAEVLSTSETPDGLVQHAEFQLGDSRVMVGGASGEWPPMPVMLHLYVDDVDGLYRRALEAGAESVREPADMFYGDRSGGVRDPFGNQWWIATHVEDVTPEEMARRQAAQEGAERDA